MADYIESAGFFPLPGWAKTVVSLLLIGVASKINLRPGRLILFGLVCAGALYAIFSFA